MRPRVFIGSSTEALQVAYAIQQNLELDAEVTVWNQGVSQLSRSALDSLVAELDRADFGIFVFCGDDVARIRNSDCRIVRDNVIFEHGLFIGRLGQDRTVFVTPRDLGDLHLPSDLAGINAATFDSQRTDHNLRAALGPACNSISTRFREIGPRRTQLTEKKEISAAWMRMLAGAVRSVRIFAGDASWAERDWEMISDLTGRGISVNVLCRLHHGHPKIRSNVIRLLRAGAAVRYSHAMPFIRGILVDWQRGSPGFALRVQKSPKTVRDGEPGSPELYHYDAIRHFPPDGAPHVEALGELFDSLFDVAGEAIELTPLDLPANQLVSIIRAAQIVHYSGIVAADIETAPLGLAALLSTCKYVKQPRLSRVRALVTAFTQQRLRHFQPVCCIDGRFTVTVLPPIVEQHDGKYIIIDGIHRLFHHLVVDGQSSAECLILRVGTPLPSTPLPLSEVSIVSAKRSRAESFVDYDHAQYRPMKQLDNVLRSDPITTRCD